MEITNSPTANSRMKMHEAQFIYIFSIYLIIFFSFIMITDIIILFFGFMPLSLSLSLSLFYNISPSRNAPYIPLWRRLRNCTCTAFYYLQIVMMINVALEAEQTSFIL